MSTSNIKITDMKDYVKKTDIGNLVCALKPRPWHYGDYNHYYITTQFYNEVKEQLKMKCGIEIPQEIGEDSDYEY